MVAVVVAAVFAGLLSALVVAAAMRTGEVDSPSGPSAAGLDIGAVLAEVQHSVVTVWVQRAEGVSTGTGVIISDDGLVLTNAHVLGLASTASVMLSDGREYTAELLGSMPADDVALLSIDGVSGLSPAELGSSAAALVGDEVVAIGNALGLGGLPSVTSGIISAKDRTIQTASVVLRELIQTDAAINQGNSGGPLVDADGRVIGINTAIAAQAQNIGFAIPIDTVKPLIEDLRAGRGSVTPNSAFLGVQTLSIESLSPEDRTDLAITASRGAVIVNVVPGSAADGADLQPGDVVIAVDGEAVTSSGDLTEKILSHQPGDRITVEYERDGQRRTAVIELERRDQSGG